MPPSFSHSPRRKRVRRVFSASAGSGNRWKAAPFAATKTLRRRESSPSSSAAFTFSPDDDSEESVLEDDDEPDEMGELPTVGEAADVIAACAEDMWSLWQDPVVRAVLDRRRMWPDEGPGL